MEKSELDEETRKQVEANILLMKANQAYANGDYAEASNLLKRATGVLPTNSVLWSELAKSLREQGDTEAEIKAIKKVVELGDADAYAWLQMALAYRVMGKNNEELFCLIMAADKGNELIYDGDLKPIIIDRYKELTMSRVQAMDPLSSEYKVPMFEPDDKEGEDQQTCIICFQSIDPEKDKAQTLQCPHCKRVAHFICLGSWLNANNICPVCHGLLDFDLDNYKLDEIMGVDE